MVRRYTSAAAPKPWRPLPPPGPRLAARVASGIPFPGEAGTTSRLLYGVLPVTFRSEAAGAPATSSPARGLVALEGGCGIDVLSGAATAEQVEERLLHHARLMTGM
ncbi:hypothetical protein [Streptomyces sp. E2N166]|uniref:hypothetical protein n=1 Tax=Streptomyces sp. E2N166 TaxID=1851909 RepID=UPI0012917FE9|nr:hypothetical protein [Streptomyces sp. E2N166]